MRTAPLLLLSALLPACTSVEAPATKAAAPQASAAEVEAWIAEGRALLAAGKPLEAEAPLARAAAAEGDSLRTRMWVLRAWMDQGRSNDTLDALDELDRAGVKGVEMSYLYGMAFARRAEGYLADGVTDSSVQNNFLDATGLLGEATAADPQRFRDAFLPLARAAWYVSEFEIARAAADRAVELAPDSAAAWLERGRITMTQFAEASADEPEGARAQALLAEARDAFQRALAAAGTPADEAGALLLADAALQLGHTCLWLRAGPEATEAYGIAAAWNPQGFDYAQVLESLRGVPRDLADDRPSGFRAALEGARALRAELGLVDDAGAGTLLWWLGWARFNEGEFAGAEEAFQASLALVPEYVNAWFYVGLARQYGKDSEGALTAMHAGWDADPAAMVAAASGAGGALRAFEGLLAWCAEQEPPRNLDAAFLAEMLAEAMPSEARHWNNLGLFLRDEGERLEIAAYRKKEPAPDPALLADLYGRSFLAYQRALELNPDDPQLVNDTALMLHYHLDGDPADVETLYRRALDRTDELLAGELSEDDRARYAQTQKDIAFNLKALLDPRVEDEDAEDDAEAEDDAGGTTAASAPSEKAGG
ncbi:MAG TPA: hypothetical protein VF530_05410 [Planctomycetota bacterium]